MGKKLILNSHLLTKEKAFALKKKANARFTKFQKFHFFIVKDDVTIDDKL